MHCEFCLNVFSLISKLGCVCFGWKSLLEMLFRKWGCLVGPENSIFRKLKSVDPKKKPLTMEMLLHFYFPFKPFPENDRERERESARAREENIRSEIASSSSSPTARSRSRSRIAIASWSRSQSRSRSRRRLRSRIAIVPRSRSRIAIVPRSLIVISDRAVDRDLGLRSRRDRDLAVIAIVNAPSITISDRDHDAVVELETFLELMISGLWLVFSGLWLVFSDLCFPSSFPNTRKYFPENFLKCNQTPENIFLFRKLAFPENMYFPENVLQQPNTALILLICREKYV